MLSNLCRAYENEKSINVKIIFQNEELRSTNASLRKDNESLMSKVQKLLEAPKKRPSIAKEETTVAADNDEHVKTETIKTDDE